MHNLMAPRQQIPGIKLHLSINWIPAAGFQKSGTIGCQSGVMTWPSSFEDESIAVGKSSVSSALSWGESRAAQVHGMTCTPAARMPGLTQNKGSRRADRRCARSLIAGSVILHALHNVRIACRVATPGNGYVSGMSQLGHIEIGVLSRRRKKPTRR